MGACCSANNNAAVSGALERAQKSGVIVLHGQKVQTVPGSFLAVSVDVICHVDVT